MFQPAWLKDSGVDLRRTCVDLCARCPTRLLSLEQHTKSRIVLAHLMSLCNELCVSQGSEDYGRQLTFLNSEAHFRMVVEIGGGSVA